MRTYELGMTTDYVKNWDFADAMREIYQNCIDASAVDPSNEWFSNYNPEGKILRVGNMRGNITPNTLLLGSSSKRDDSKTIGEHGEGYKVGIIVLMRTGHSFQVYNQEKSELWKSRVVKSKRYGEDIVVVDISKCKSAPNFGFSLVFEIGNVSQEEYDSVVKRTLWLRDYGEHFDGLSGSCLIEKEEKGKIYVNGLFVREMYNLDFGWNFNPGVLKLDRDRQTLDSFDVIKTCSALAQSFSADQINHVKNAYECQWLLKMLNEETKESKAKMQEVYNDSYTQFKEQHGENVVPVKTNVEFNRLAREGKTCVMLKESEYEMVSRAEDFKGSEDAEEVAYEESLEDLVKDLGTWFSEYQYYLNPTGREELEKIIEKIKEKVNG